MSPDENEYPDWIWNVLVCPYCGGKLDHRSSAAEVQPAAPSTPLPRRAVGPSPARAEECFGRSHSWFAISGPEIPCYPLSINPGQDPSLAGSRSATGNVKPAAASWLLPERGTASSCWTSVAEASRSGPLVESAGFNCIGLDYADPGSHLIGDAHALPFADGTFDRVPDHRGVGVFPVPLVAARERFIGSLAPGGRICQEPWHLIPTSTAATTTTRTAELPPA